MKIVYILLISIKIDTTKETQNTYRRLGAKGSNLPLWRVSDRIL